MIRTRIILLSFLATILILPITGWAEEWTAIGPQGSTPRKFYKPPASCEYTQFAATMRTLFGRNIDGDWIPISPDYGGFTTWVIDDIAVSPTDPDRIYLLRTGPYAGTSIYRTLDGGFSWDILDIPVPPLENYFYSIAIHPENPDTLITGAFYSIFRSTDAGDSWEEIGLTLPYDPIPTDFLIRSDDPSVVLMSSRGDDPGIYISSDLGDTWNRVFADEHIVQLVDSPEDPLVLFACSESLTQSSKIYRSIDGGSSWDLWSADSHLLGRLQIDPDDDRNMYMLGRDDQSRGAVLASADAGSTWSIITTTEDLEASSFIGLGIAPGTGGSPAELLIGTNFWGAFSSNDNGSSWEPERFYAAYMGAIAHDEYEPEIVYMGTSSAMNQSLANGRLFVSEDYGSTWSYHGVSDDPGHPVGRVFAIEPSFLVQERVWIGTSYGLFLSEDAGRTMTHKKNGLVRTIWEDHQDENHLIFGTAQAPIWPVVLPKIFETTDGGDTWNEIREFDFPVMDIEVDEWDGRIYCALGGLTISGLSVPGAGGLFWKDEGSEWTEAADLSGKHVSSLLIYPGVSDFLFVTTNDSGVYTSEDRGITWAQMNNGLDNTDVRVVEEIGCGCSGIELVAGTWGGTYWWKDGIWTNLSDGIVTFPSGGDSLALQTTVIDYDRTTEKLYIGSAGRSAYVTELLTPTGIEEEETNGGAAGIPRSYALGQNYPNPLNPSTTITFEIPGSSGSRTPDDTGSHHVTIGIYDIRGRLIRKLVDSDFQPGQHQVVWNGMDDSGRKVPSGHYLYTMKAREEIYTRKMTILK
jgi:photosystem II stability/assembly factor-like uncharacterized protein